MELLELSFFPKKPTAHNIPTYQVPLSRYFNPFIVYKAHKKCIVFKSVTETLGLH